MKLRKSVLLFSLFTILAFTGCKSTPVENYDKVDPLELIDNNNSFYLRIPRKVDEKLVKRILMSSVNNLSESDASRVTERVDVIYAGFNKTRKSTDYQVSASLDFPEVYVNHAFTKKNGWTSDNLQLEDKNGKLSTYKIFTDNSVLLSFPDTYTVALGRAVPDMVSRFHNLKNNIQDESAVPLNQNIFSWLSINDDDDLIKFYATKPTSFLTMLTGANLNFKLVYVRGFMRTDPKHEDQYLLNIEFEFKDQKYLPAAKGALSVAFGLTDSDVISDSPVNLKVSNIKIRKEQLYSIFVL